MKVMRKMSKAGDEAVATWDETTVSPAALEAIEKEFNEHMKAGGFAGNIDTGELVKDFDSNANLLLIPAMVGG